MHNATKVYTASELVKKHFEKPAWLLEPLLQRGGDWLVAGEEDAYKSMFLVQMCIHASLGLDYLFLKVEEPLRILYINADDNARLVQNRLKLLTPKGQELNDNFMLVCQPALQFNHAGRLQIQEWVQNYRPDIVILDHLTSFVVGGTVDQVGMQEYILLQKWICSQDLGVIALSHFNRTNKETKDEPIGRRIGGINLIKSGHSVITAHEKLAEHVGDQGHRRFHMHMERNKNIADPKQFETDIEVVSVPDEGRIFMREA